MSTYLNAYISEIRNSGNLDMAESIKNTAIEFTKNYLDSFSFIDHEIGLLFGNVQAGKTAQMFGIMCAAADASFPLFILLTTDNVALHTQTYDRVAIDLEGCGFCVCGEADKQKFVDNELMQPVIIVLKKNSKVLLQWYNTLASSSFVKGNSLFIVDDEADAASLNTLINKKRVSTINSRLTNIRNSSIGSVYLQVTGTPQSLLLQASNSNFRPSFTTYFQPGSEYLGGDFFFGEDKSPIHFIDDDIEPKDDMYKALVHHIVVSAQLFISGKEVCNFIIHPGVKKATHKKAKKDVEIRLQLMESIVGTQEFKDDIFECWSDLNLTKSEKIDFNDIYEKSKTIVLKNEIKILVMNGDTSITDEKYKTGSNIVIGGNVLGRGVTFPKLQTLHYTRTAKKPQADTMWQHSRMFGYDRDAGMMKMYLTKSLYKLFSDINATNNSIISQVEKNLDKIQLFYPDGINPTRTNIMDMRMVDIVSGGTNYYPIDPENTDKEKLDSLMSHFESTNHQLVSIKLILEILSHIVPSEDFNLMAFKGAIKALFAKNPMEQGVLIVRRGRAVTQGTGSLISPNDRVLGDLFTSRVVLTMYQITGDMGWKQKDIWVPNIKLPEFINYYDVQ